MRNLLLLCLTFILALPLNAQRRMENLNRDLVAQKTAAGVFLSWRITGQEYYDVTYNVYRDGVKITASPLTVSNYVDAQGTTSSQYSVAAVVRGKEQQPCKAVAVWEHDYLEIPMGGVKSRRGYDITDQYEPNDACAADLDGDGELEIILKRINRTDQNALFPTDNDSAYTVLEAYKLDGTRLWQIDCGPNMVSMANTETDIVAYDWDEDGKAEVLLRGADGMIVHYAGGDQMIGSASVNTRNTVSHVQNYTYTNTGAEYLIYMNGETGKPYEVMTYPLERGLAADWGDSHGHRSSKYFFGAPYLDGRHPSIFLARGIYTKHKMIAYDVDKSTHKLVERWRWNSLGGDWYGQGYHNFGIADVDWDGRDEICYGSMVIDDDGHGLSTTGLGHGDAQHCGDLDPYRHGQEIFACNEDNPGCNYRDATTSQIYYRLRTAKDDGRAMAGNFTNKYPGSQCISARSGLISSVTGDVIDGATTAGVCLNFRLYWNGDLCESTFNNEGKDDATEGIDACISDYGEWKATYEFKGVMTNNSTKATPCLTADILGDWREEVVLRAADGKSVRIYTTPIPTDYRNYTLMHDHQYRNGVVWEMCGYNQPPHASYFLGQLEGITVAPPPLMTNGREEVADGGVIGTELNDKHVLLCETNDMNVSVSDGASPYILTVNTPTWVQGHDDNDNITTDTFHTVLSGGAFTGTMRLVKQGDGILSLPAVNETYKGETSIWAGTLRFDGQMPYSHVWLNRFARLESNGVFGHGITADYASVISPAGDGKAGTLTVDSLVTNFGAGIDIDLFADGSSDTIRADYWQINRVAWENGPKYSTPVLKFTLHDADSLKGETRWLIADTRNIVGGVSSLTIEGLDQQKYAITTENGKVYVTVSPLRKAADVEWTGTASNVWNLGSAENFLSGGSQSYFVTGDNVLFGDSASRYDINLTDNVVPDTVRFVSSKDYTLSGSGSVTGNAVLLKDGTGKLTISNTNNYTGGTIIRGGTVSVNQLTDAYRDNGALGGKPASADKFVIEHGGTLQTTGEAVPDYDIKIGEGGGTIWNEGLFDMQKAFRGSWLTKKGAGNLLMETTNSLDSIVVNGGTLSYAEGTVPAKLIVMRGGTLQDPDNSYTYTTMNIPIDVPAGANAKWNLDARCNYTNRLTGKGKIGICCTYLRAYLGGDWSDFEGTVVVSTMRGSGFQIANSKGMPKATLDISSGDYVSNCGTTFRIGKVIGKGYLAGLNNGGNTGDHNTWQVGNDDNWSWAGAVTGEGTCFEKVGLGRMTVSGASDFTGSCIIREGDLHINKGAKLGTGNLTVASGATLSGLTNTDHLDNSSVTVNGTVSVGATATAVFGVMRFGGSNVTFNSGSTLRLGAGRAATAYLNGGTSIEDIGRLRMNGTISLFLSKGYTPQAGDSIRLFKCESFDGSPVLDLPALAEGLSWDTSSISSGLLRVTDVATGISEAGSGPTPTTRCTIVNMQGAVVASFMATETEAKARFSSLPLHSGTYILRVGGKSMKMVR